MAKELTIEKSKGYATRENLMRSLENKGLLDLKVRYFVCRKSDGKWTAIFLASEYCNLHGGYIGFAAQHGFMSV